MQNEVEQKKPSMWEQHRAKYGCQCTPKTGSCQKPKAKVVDIVAPSMPEFDYKKFGEAMAFAIKTGTAFPTCSY